MNLSQDEKQLIALITQAVVALLALYNGLIAPLYNWPNITIATQDIDAIICLIVVIGLAAWNAWKNRNFTYASKLGQLVIDAVKAGILEPEKVEALIDEACDQAQTEQSTALEQENALIEQEINEFLDRVEKLDQEQSEKLDTPNSNDMEVQDGNN